MPDIRIPLADDLHAKLKASAALHRKTMIELVRDLILAHLERAKR